MTDNEMSKLKNFVPLECLGEKCSVCGLPACAKVGEEILSSDLMPQRHNVTAYLCAEDFKRVFGQYPHYFSSET